MATEILKIDASWAEEFTKTSEQILMTPSVSVVEAFSEFRGISLRDLVVRLLVTSYNAPKWYQDQEYWRQERIFYQ